MMIAGKQITYEEAYELLSRDESLVQTVEATFQEREALYSYGILRSHRDYLLELQRVRGN